jgi:hypothetical protein
MRWPGRKKEDVDKYSIDELIVLERFDDAQEVLLKRIRLSPRDFAARVKLGDVLAAAGLGDQAVRTYIQAVEKYSADGFFDKALAVLVRVQKDMPDEPRIEGALRRVHQARDREKRRHIVVESLSREELGELKLNVVQGRQAWNALSQTGLTDALTGDDLGRFVGGASIVWLERGDALTSVGAEDVRLFVVLEGEVEAWLEHRETRHPLGFYKPGQILGDRALFEEEPWLANYRARRPTRLLALDREGLEHALAGCSNPRGLLDSLRKQANDRHVSAAVYQIRHAEGS